MGSRLTLFIVTLCLSACASMNMLTSEVTAYGSWPTERKAGTYAFERLPSQQARLGQQQALEAAAKPALEASGFKWVNEGKTADYLVQVQARSTANERSRTDPFWAWQSVPRPYPGAPGRPYHAYSPGLWVHPLDVTSYEREVVLLIRDAKTGQTLWESHAVSDGSSPSFKGLLDAMFNAALKDFPQTNTGPRRVTLPLTP
jgi:Domain of unknown function (DUF4136)